jgi:hypothetical protein
MSRLVYILWLSSFLVLFTTAYSQQLSVPQRDGHAITLATQAYHALGGTLPTDTKIRGTYSRVIGSTQDSGTIEVLTRGLNQTSTKITNSEGTAEIIYSRGYAVQKDQNGIEQFTLEKSLGSISSISPLVIIAAAVLDQNATAQYVGIESVDGKPANHIRICPSSADQNFSKISLFGAKDIWLDADSLLPLEISYQVLDSEGEAAIPVTFLFSQYKALNGVFYPFQIQESLNATPYMAISITSVSSGASLTDANFSLK